MKAGEGDSYNLNNTHKSHWEGNLNKGLEEGRWATSIERQSYRGTQANGTASQNSGGWKAGGWF